MDGERWEGAGATNHKRVRDLRDIYPSVYKSIKKYFKNDSYIKQWSAFIHSYKFIMPSLYLILVWIKNIEHMEIDDTKGAKPAAGNTAISIEPRRTQFDFFCCYKQIYFTCVELALPFV